MKNPVGWFEIYVNDMDRAKGFYEKLLGIELGKLDMPGLVMRSFPSDMSTYGCSGALVKMPGLSPSGVSTIVYFSVDDCGKVEKNIVSLGGKVHTNKTSIGEHGFITLGYDTEGNMFGLHSRE